MTRATTQDIVRSAVHLHDTKHTENARSGFILPAALFTMLVVTLLAATLQAAVWQSTRHARLGFAGERALHAADAAIAHTVANWNARTFASTPIGTRTTSSITLAPALNATVTVVRTAANSAMVEALATSTQNGTPLNANRHVTRALTLVTPPLPLSTPLTTLGAVTITNPGTVSNTDEIPTGWTTECLGLTRIDATTPNPAPDIASQRTLFDTNWNRWTATASHTDDASAVTALAPIVTGTSCAPGTGEPSRSGIFTAACTNEWGARHITNNSPSTHPAVTLSGVSRYQGVLLVDSDLTITGSLDINGLLVVEGALDTTTGTLNIFGAALVRDNAAHGSHLGIATRVRYSRCALRQALSAVGAPAAITTRGWLERF